MWTPYVFIFLGAWQLFAPVTFRYEHTLISASDFITAFLLIGGGLYLRRGFSHRAAWGLAGVGLWLQLAPLIFWTHAPAAYLSNTLVGVLVIFFAIILPSHSGEEKSRLPLGWSFNPSAWPARILIACLACIGWFISRYLAAYQLGYITTMWDPFFGDGTLKVITSSVSKAFPVSDAGLGAVSYTLELLLVCYGGQMRWRRTPWMVIIYGILVVPLSLVSITLIILQPVAVGAWCTLCLITACLMLVMALFAVSELVLVMQILAQARRRKKNLWRLLWDGFEDATGAEDRRTPSVDSSWKVLFKSMATGITPTPSLFLSAALGLLLMVSGGSDSATILGALTIVASVISMAEPIRSWRHANTAFGLLLLVSLLGNFSALYLGVGLALILLSFIRGKISETCDCRNSLFPLG